MPDEILQSEIRVLISEIAEIEPEDATLDAHFITDLGMDSMMALEILASLEKKYKIVIPEDQLIKLTSLRNTVDIVKRLQLK